MDAVPQTLLEYVTVEGIVPFHEWLDNLQDVQARAKIRIRLNRVRLGNFGDAKPIGDGVCELRVHLGPGYRVYFARPGAAMVLLLCAGDKSSQRHDAARAKEYWRDFQWRSL